MGKGMIPQQDIEAIRDLVSIEEVVSEYVSLSPAGPDSLKGLSPFNDEKTPSFFVRPQRGFFHCFSSGEGGDVITFLQKMEQLSFPEAVEQLAQRVGYQIHYEGVSSQSQQRRYGTRRRLVQANEAARDFYCEQLLTPEGEPARAMLLGRGFSREVIEHFQCGYAPKGWDTLTRHLQRQGFTFEELEAAGLSKRSRQGTQIDRFHGRAMWPICNTTGEVIGFGARKLFDDDKLGKYMNTPETMLYKKAKVLFGLNLAKKHIAQSHQCVVVEGYTDVMAMYAAGITTAVAACGTAFGDEHVASLRRFMLDDNYYRGEIIYTFDGDAAGKAAALKVFQGEQQFAGQKFVCVAPDNMDPCELRQKQGDAALRDLVARRVPMFEFAILALLEDYDLSTTEGRVAALRRAIPMTANIRDVTMRKEYARNLAGWVGWNDPIDIVIQVEKAAQKNQYAAARGGRRAGQPVRSPQKTGASRQNSAPQGGGAAKTAPRRTVTRTAEGKLAGRQRAVLRLALHYPFEIQQYWDELTEECFPEPTYREIFLLIQATRQRVQPESVRQWMVELRESTDDLYLRAVLSELAIENIPVEESALEQYMDSTVAALLERWAGMKIGVMKSELARRKDCSSPEYQEMFRDVVSFEAYRKTLKARAIGQ